jgi:kinesin family protein 15
VFSLEQEELIRAKADVRSSDGNKKGYFHVQNVRESLNNLRVSLNRSLLIPNIDNDTDDEVNVDEEDIRELRQQIDEFYSSCEGNPIDISVSEDCVQYYSVEESCEADVACGDEIEKGEVCSGEAFNKLCHEGSVASDNTLYESANNTSRAIRSSFRDSISVSSSCRSPMFLEEPQLSESPKIRNIPRKSVAFSSCLGSSNKVEEKNSNSNKDLLGKSFTKDEVMRSSLRSSKVFPGPTESLAASLKRGLQIIDSHQRNSSLNKSSTSFSFGRLSSGDSCDQTMQQKKYSIDERTATLLCGYCRKIIIDQDSREVQGSLKSCIDTAEAKKSDGLTDKAPKVCCDLFSGIFFNFFLYRCSSIILC